MKIDKLINFMVSMMSVSQSTELNKYGKFSQKSFNIYPFQLLLKIKSSAYMEVYHLKLKHLIKSDQLTEFKIFHTAELYVIFYGQIQLMKEDQDLVHHQEVLDIAGAKILLTSSITGTT